MTADEAHQRLDAALAVQQRENKLSGGRKTAARMAIDTENVRTAALVAIACELGEMTPRPLGEALDVIDDILIIHEGDSHYCADCGIANSLTHREDCRAAALLARYGRLKP